MNDLQVDLAGEKWSVSATDELTFGRDAMLVVDTNRYLHRRLGVFRYQGDMWWLANTGSAIGLEMVDCASPSQLTLAPGSATPIPFAQCWVRFQAGRSSYELVVSLPTAIEFEATEQESDSSTTIRASRFNLNEEQRLLLVALAEERLRGAGAALHELPTNRQLADRLGWTITKFNRKLDNLCTKFDRLGVPGIKGDLGGMAASRRERLVDHVVTGGIVVPQDLKLLDGMAT